VRIELRNLSAWFGTRQVLDGIELAFEPHAVTALIGPSGSGKSTLLRIINRLHEETPGARIEGTVLFDGEDIYGRGVDPVAVRTRVGFVSQPPAPFPSMSIMENAVCGLRFNGVRNRQELGRAGERALRLVGLWDEVRDRVDRPARSLSSGQQQRLCVARALAVEPQAILLDEPSSSLDPSSVLLLEALMTRLAEECTVVLVTHNLQQAARVSRHAALLSATNRGPARLVEAAPTVELFSDPATQVAETYLSGRPV
jgi:phosphate transport system ATP-binding protein